jgi:hypothetical protein
VVIMNQHHLSKAGTEVFPAPWVSAAAEALAFKCGPTHGLIIGTDLSDEKKERAPVRSWQLGNISFCLCVLHVGCNPLFHCCAIFSS